MFTLKIELRVDHLDKSKDEMIKQAAKVAAKHLYTTALLLQDKSKPQIALEGGDFFTAAEEILLADDIPPDEIDAPIPQDGDPGSAYDAQGNLKSLPPGIDHMPDDNGDAIDDDGCPTWGPREDENP